jgi:signal transduction histidine kinase
MNASSALDRTPTGSAAPKTLDVLLVEDNPGDARLVREALADVEGTDVALAHVSRLSEARTLVEAHRYDVVLLDLSLPDARGLATLHQLQGHAANIPIVVLTGLDDEATAIQAVQEGAQDYLHKGRLEGGLLVRALRYAIERHRIMARLDEAQREQLRLKDELLSHVSHELRTPLAAIYQFVRILLDGVDGDVSDKQRQHLEITLRNVKQLRTMVGDLIDAAAAQSGKLTVQARVVQLAPLLADVVDTLATVASTAGISLSAEVEPLPPVYADPQRIQQVLSNLTGNALKFTPRDGSVVVRAGLAPGDTESVCVSVTDTGCGIAPELTAQVFERLYQVQDAIGGSRKGLGLGLFIARELVARHGGRIWVESAPGQGSTFSFTLPVFSLPRLVGTEVAACIENAEHLAVMAVDVGPATRDLAAGGVSAMLDEVRAIVHSTAPAGSVLLPPPPGTDATGLLLLTALAAAEAEAHVAHVREAMRRRRGDTAVRVELMPLAPVRGKTPDELACDIAVAIRDLVETWSGATS